MRFGPGAYVKRMSGLYSLYQLGYVLGQFKNILNQPQATLAHVAPYIAMI